MSTKRRVQLGAAGILAGLLMACSSREDLIRQPVESVSGVQIATVRQQTVPELYRADGTIHSVNTSALSAQIGGTVREVLVRAGDRVARGQLLATIDDRTPQAQLGMAQAGVQEATQGLVEIDHAIQAATADRQFAEATYKRYQELLARKSVSQQEFEGVETRYKAALANEQAMEAKKKQVEAKNQQAKAQVASAETYFSFSRIVSPINGVVTARSVDPGTVVMPGMPLLTVEETSRYRLEANLPTEFVPQVHLNEDVSVSVNGKTWQGRIAEIVPATDPSSRTTTVKTELPPGCNCQSGDYGIASFPVGDEKTLAVPQTALIENGELQGLFVINAQSLAEYRLVKTGRTMGDRVEILSGLSDGERVAVSGINLLKEGVRVEIP
jgi:membrane fusion protein, multidrug efflux system